MRFFTILIVAAALTLTSHPGWAEKPVEPVQVMNTTANPVPVAPQGTTTITGNVAITGSPTVTVGNTVKTTPAAPQFVQQSTSIFIVNGVQGSLSPSFTAATGRMLIFDHVSAEANCEPGQTAWIYVTILHPDRTFAGQFPIAPADLGSFSEAPGFAAREHLIFAQALRVYVEPDSDYFFSAIRSSDSGACSFNISYAAHSIDVP